MNSAASAILFMVVGAIGMVALYLYRAWRAADYDWVRHARFIGALVAVVLVLIVLVSGPEIVALIGLGALIGGLGVLLVLRPQPGTPRWLGWAAIALSAAWFLQLIVRLTILPRLN